MRLKQVPTATGLEWVKQGIRTFGRQPLAISGLFFMFMAGLSLMSIVPFLGSIVAIVITPAATLGLMAASRDATHGKFPMPSTLVTAFRQGAERTRAMLILGGLYGASLLMLVAIAMVLGPDVPDSAAETGLTPELISTLLESPGLWLSMALYVPVLMMFWHAPALVHWHAVSPVKSLFFSLMACWNNRGAMALYLLAWFGLMLVGAFLIAMVGSMVGGTSMGFMVYPMMLMFASVFYASLFFTFKDSFEFDDDIELIVD
jgi:MFS family permease